VENCQKYTPVYLKSATIFDDIGEKKSLLLLLNKQRKVVVNSNDSDFI